VEDISAAFAAFGKTAPKGRMSREALLSVLQQLGENMQKDEIQESLQVSVLGCGVVYVCVFACCCHRIRHGHQLLDFRLY
jgi:Ca2+-binding EF-hand superfamily protein